MEYGLIGEKLGHSASKEIHEQLADYSYELHPLTKEDFPIFMEEKAFRALNVTIPTSRQLSLILPPWMRMQKRLVPSTRL